MTKEKLTPGEGRTFEPTVDTTREMDTRKPEIFVPSEDIALDTPPEAITTGEQLPNVSDFAGLKMQRIRLKGVKLFFCLALALVVSIVSLESYEIISRLGAFHWSLGAAFAIMVVAVFASGCRLAWQMLLDSNNIGSLEDTRELAAKLRNSRAKEDSAILLTNLREFYADKPQGAHLLRCLDQLPDYSDDSEVIQHLDKVFLRPLDEEATRRISVHSAKIGIVIGLSPWATMDVMLALWRNLIMVEDVSQLYGVKPGIGNRFRLMRMIASKMAVIGASQVLIDNTLKQLESAGAIIPSMTAIAQGLGAGIYSTRIGVTCMEVTRPIPFQSGDLPETSSLIEPLISELKKQLLPAK